MYFQRKKLNFEQITSPHSFKAGHITYFDKNYTLPTEEYAFGVSVELDGLSSGITWSGCMQYAKDKPKPPELPNDPIRYVF